MSDLTNTGRGIVRTLWPMAIGHLLAWAVTLTRPAGVHVDSAGSAEALSWALGTAVYLLALWLERRAGTGRFAAAGRRAGAFLLSLGFQIGPPSYVRQLPESVPARLRQ